MCTLHTVYTSGNAATVCDLTMRGHISQKFEKKRALHILHTLELNIYSIECIVDASILVERSSHRCFSSLQRSCMITLLRVHHGSKCQTWEVITNEQSCWVGNMSHVMIRRNVKICHNSWTHTKSVEKYTNIMLCDEHIVGSQIWDNVEPLLIRNLAA